MVMPASKNSGVEEAWAGEAAALGNGHYGDLGSFASTRPRKPPPALFLGTRDEYGRGRERHLSHPSTKPLPSRDGLRHSKDS